MTVSIEELLAALKAIIDEAEGRSLTDEEVERYEKLEVELAAKQRDVQVRSRQTAYETVTTTPVVATGTSKKTGDTLERAFEAYMRTGQQNADIVELRAQSVGTDTAGGFLVPDTMRDKLVDRLKEFGGLAGAVEEITTSGGEDMRWPTLDDTANAGVIAAEGTAPGSGGADLVFGEKTLGAFKYVAPGTGQLPLRVSVELLQDSAFDIQGLVERKLGERIGRKQAVDWVSGAGTTLPFGITTGTNTQAFDAAGITYAELLAAVHSLDPAYRESASWSFNDATLGQVETLVDGNQRPLLNQANDGISVGRQNQMLLGYPIVIDQAFPTYADATTNRWGVFGDLRQGYVIRRVQGLTLIVNPYSRANEGQVEYVLWARGDGVPQDPNAYRILVNELT